MFAPQQNVFLSAPQYGAKIGNDIACSTLGKAAAAAALINSGHLKFTALISSCYNGRMQSIASAESAMPEFPTFVPEMTAIVWSGIFASLITVSGVLFSDWRNSKRLHQQHEFTERENERSRQMALRKDVYLPAAAALTKLQAHLFSIGSLDANDPAANPMAQFGEAALKLGMVAGTETAILAQQLVTEYGLAYATLARLRMAVLSANSDASTNKLWKDKAQGNVDRVNLEIAKFLESANSDAVQFAALQGSCEGFRGEFAYWATRECEALQRASAETNKFIRSAIDFVIPIGELGTRLLILIRAELGQDTDELSFERAMKEGRDKTLLGLRIFLSQLDADLAENLQSSDVE